MHSESDFLGHPVSCVHFVCCLLLPQMSGSIGSHLLSPLRDHPSHSWPMLGGMWGARLDNPSPKQSKQSRQSPKSGEQPKPKEARTRRLLAGLVANMLRSPVSWASVYLADQVLVNLKLIFSFLIEDNTRYNFKGYFGQWCRR